MSTGNGFNASDKEWARPGQFVTPSAVGLA
jgi:hypothetical protein